MSVAIVTNRPGAANTLMVTNSLWLTQYSCLICWVYWGPTSKALATGEVFAMALCQHSHRPRHSWRAIIRR